MRRAPAKINGRFSRPNSADYERRGTLNPSGANYLDDFLRASAANSSQDFAISSNRSLSSWRSMRRAKSRHSFARSLSSDAPFAISSPCVLAPPRKYGKNTNAGDGSVPFDT